MAYIKNDDLSLDDVLKLMNKYGYKEVTEKWSFGNLVIEAAPNLTGVFFDLATARQWMMATHREQLERERERTAEGKAQNA